MSFRTICAAFCATAAISAPAFAATGAAAPASPAAAEAQVNTLPTVTPIKHLVIIYDENVSFDHYFATYPRAANPPGAPVFTAAAGTPAVDNLLAAQLLTNNPNFTNPENGADAANPFRLERAEAETADQDHKYTPEQEAYDHGKADLFPKFTGMTKSGGVGAFNTQGQVMGYYDGNTVTALWNYAQHFAMSDHAYGDTYGPSTPGALEIVSGQTNGFVPVQHSKTGYFTPDGQGGFTLINDVDPAYDKCADPKDQGLMQGRNIGDLLNAARISWGGFMGGFDISVTNANGSTDCKRSTDSALAGKPVPDYNAHHAWFQYYATTANPSHARPAGLVGYSLDANGAVDPANHDYDLADFTAALHAGYSPAVAYVKLPAYQDGHAGYSNPLDEQAGLVTLINQIERGPDWKSTAIIIAYDDSDGWYDHAFTPPRNPSAGAADALDGKGKCGVGTPRDGLAGKPVDGRCGPGTRVPFLVISPWVAPNHVDHTLITQASVPRFIEDNWLHGRRIGGGSFDATAGSLTGLFDFAGKGDAPALILDPATGEPVGN